MKQQLDLGSARIDRDTPELEIYLPEYSDMPELVTASGEVSPRLENSYFLVTAHDAFSYFGRAYGFEVRGLLGVSTASEAGTSDVQKLATFIAERRIPAIFIETSVPPRYVEALAEAVAARGRVIEIGGSLFSDSLGNPGTPEGSYPGTVRANVETIVTALSGGAGDD